ncbi:hypothetical protein Q5424_18490 [Conexibacter sp. JD483]|uniref:hypothetical protein n=1 Tax=unclassified Conexibacter TaxID=2627773 RepID=UPI002726265E|nr:MULTISPECIES: hypothetical protein [unclassified Conexibacter]MDO8185486.1 hypothetical protein [Conexibacter sp. CPCC 205706]MDO8197327.1 hypothetical protein [Conexibacter sp. CPCC 205762]MDR9371091.1 hypothetical protein [Conexibacter sp. JD483]
MTKLLLSLHVIVAIVAVGPVTVAASVFPRTAREAAAAPGDPGPLAALRTLHRICRVYALLAMLVPALGLATAGAMGVLGDVWLTTSIFLTGVAGFVLAGFVLPLQERILRELDAPAAASAIPATAARLAMTVGLFNLLWASVTVLMIVRPGSTTGA